jgi:hypothetical protein
MKAEVPSYALESRSLLQFRKDFADERENHLNPVYQSGNRNQLKLKRMRLGIGFGTMRVELEERIRLYAAS